MTVQPIHTGRIQIAEQSLFRLLDPHPPALEARTVLAITSKLVAICQRLFFRGATTDKQALIESEADAFLPPERNRYGVTLTLKEGHLIPSAGVDESNAEGCFILWPSDAQSVANEVRSYLRDRFSRRPVGVLITDNTTAPLRCGVTGMAVWPKGLAQTFCVDVFRCRFKLPDGTAGALPHDRIITLLERVHRAGLEFVKMELLYNFDGQPGFSHGQGQ